VKGGDLPRCRYRIRLLVASTNNTAGTDRPAMRIPAAGGVCCPSALANGGITKHSSAKSISPDAVNTSMRLLSQPSRHGGSVALRHAHALAFCPSTTARNAAPDAAYNVVPDGKASPGRQPPTMKVTKNAAIETAASVGPSRPNARNATV
jgi:hypothetical protein